MASQLHLFLEPNTVQPHLALLSSSLPSFIQGFWPCMWGVLGLHATLEPTLSGPLDILQDPFYQPAREVLSHISTKQSP